MNNLTPADIASWDQWRKWVDDELDYAYKLFNMGDYNEEQVDAEGEALAIRINSVPIELRTAIIPVVMSRANFYRTQRDAMIIDLEEAIQKAEGIELPYVHNDRIKKIIEEYKDARD